MTYQFPYLRAYGMQFRGFTVSCSLVIKFHKTGNNVLHSTVIEIFHGKGNCLRTNAVTYRKSRICKLISFPILLFRIQSFFSFQVKKNQKENVFYKFYITGKIIAQEFNAGWFAILPCSAKQEEDYYLVFSSYHFIDIKKNRSHGLRM